MMGSKSDKLLTMDLKDAWDAHLNEVAKMEAQACAKCRNSGLLRSPRGEEGGVKYCACPLGAERYEADLVSTTNIIAPITREWRFFPADQYGTPEFLRLCTGQAKEQRAAGRLAIAAALEKYVERELMK